MEADIKTLVDFDALAGWMDGQGLGHGAVHGVRRLAGGTQNVILSFERGDRTYVLRRPPVSPRAESNVTMQREAKVLGALAGTKVPHPALIAACADEQVIGAAFYLMEPIDGFTAPVGLPALHRASPDIRRDMGFALVDGAAALGEIDHVAVGLSDFGKPENYLARQVDRWRSQLEGYRRFEGWPGPSSLAGVAAISEFLEAERPARFDAGIMHGDYWIGNVMYRTDGPALAAIIDWELATIGDPLIDLAWIVATWPGDPAGDLDIVKVDPWDGFPSADDLVARYAARTRRSMASFDWYVVLACFKLAIILEGTFARSCAGLDPPENGKRLHETARILLRRGMRRIGGGTAGEGRPPQQ